MAIFVDTSVFVSFFNSDDQNHEKAKKIMSDIATGKYGEPLTSDYIFDETLTVMLTRTKKLHFAIEAGEYILAAYSIAAITQVVLQEAWEIFKNQNQEKMSFTDCTSRVFAENLGIRNIATFDQAFKKIERVTVID